MGNNSDSAAGGAPLRQAQEPPTAATLKERIRAIALDLSLGVEERTKKIQELYSMAAAVAPTATATSVTAANATVLAGTSATDEEGGNGDASSKSADDANVAVTMGTSLGLEACKHYKRQCSILSNCCGKIYPCRLCHNDVVDDHEINRFATKTIMCRACKTLQPLGRACSNTSCSWRETHYYCEPCRLWSDDKSKEIFHCDGCGICRIGKREDFHHCDKCRLCLPPGLYSKHTCVDSSNKCVACFERMQDSTRQVALLRCGHAMHEECQKQASSAGARTCPICRVSYLDQDSQAGISQIIEEAIAAQPMPDEYKNWVAHIHCDDCQKSAAVPFHFLAHICPSCKSYNTVVLSRKRGPPRDENPENAQEILQEGQELPSPAPGGSSAQGASAANALASDVGMDDSFVDDDGDENDSNNNDDDDDEEEEE